MQEKGNISIHTENIFPIIKKFLYSDHEIFLRELVSNAVDATQKLQKLSSIGEFNGELGELKVKVSVNKDAKTITISDNGIGMNAEEIKKYINQIAFSGATEFIEKYKDKGDEKQIIGHFGLGFYSAFMVAENVEIITKSFREEDKAARWECDGSTSFTIDVADKTERGTDIILHVAEDSLDFLENFKLQGILEKYCKFLPVTIEFEGEVINETQPLWTKNPSELSEQDYLDFYKKLYPMAEAPLFWIHLNVDYPFTLTGILYFPKIKKELEIQRNKIQLYSRQVFITDEVKDVVPEFLMLLHGVLDSPDIPLNVSRSFLQADGNVKKINAHITKKVADKLSELYKADRNAFQDKWNDISIFVKYGMLSDEKFYDRAKDFCLVKNIENQYFNLEEYKTKTADLQTDKNGSNVWIYTNEPERQDTFIKAATNKGYDVLLLDTVIDSHFVGMLEQKLEKTSIKRVDADTSNKLIEKDEAEISVLSADEETSVKSLFEKVINDTKMNVSVQPLSTLDLPVTVTQPEFIRRMQEMNRAGGMGGMFPTMHQVVINANHSLVQSIIKASDEEKEKLAKQAYDLALLSQNMLTGADLTSFINRSLELISKN
ncbi:MAG: molecular chaperone HtpG [Bacteroidota bacterium]|jgi:molecular chaperone HtpG